MVTSDCTRNRQLSITTELKTIQRKFGGLRVLRKELGYEDTDFGKGKHRSKLASKHGYRGRKAELLLEIKLIYQFGELSVHTESFMEAVKIV
jgi:hypothetical protein